MSSAGSIRNADCHPLTIPGVLHFVGIGKMPVPIDDAEIAALQSAVRSGLSTEPWPYLETGQQVRLKEGPLAGMEGILIGTSKKDRLIVSVTLLKRSVAVAIERHWVAPLDERTSGHATQAIHRQFFRTGRRGLIVANS